MSGPTSPVLPEPYGGTNGKGLAGRLRSRPLLRRPRLLAGILLATTLVTTTLVGARMAHNFQRDLPEFTAEDLASILPMPVNLDGLLAGLPFSLTLLTILLAHELGHYFACVYYRIQATPPYFIPAPSLVGTFGAFIRIRSPIYSRRALFDIGVAGPLAGFLVLLPAMAIGMAFSKVVPGAAERGELMFGTPLLQWVVQSLLFPGAAAGDIYLHPMARAAWVGLLATALNLLPIGQLDGGHILYAMAGRWHKWLSRLFVAALIPLGFIYSYSWLVWAAFLLLFGMRHPVICDVTPLGAGRRKLAWLAWAVFLLSFTPAPVRLLDGF